MTTTADAFLQAMTQLRPMMADRVMTASASDAQSGATPIHSALSVVITGGTNNSLILPSLRTNEAGSNLYVVINDTAATVQVFAALNDTMNKMANGSLIIAAGGVAMFVRKKLTFPDVAPDWVGAPFGATAATGSLALSGPTGGLIGAASTNFTVTLAGLIFNGSTTVTLDDGGQGGTFTPSVGAPGTSTVTVTPGNGATGFTFTYTPAVTGALTLTVSNAQTWNDPSPATYTSTGSYTATGPASGAIAVASTNFTVALHAGMAFNGSQTITIADGGKGGTITPSVGAPGTSTVTVTPSAAATSFTFTYTPVVAGAITLTTTNAQGWTNPSPASYTSVGDFAASGPASGAIGAASTNFTVTLHAGMTFNGAQTITIADGGKGGTITPSVGAPATSTKVVIPSNGATGFTFTYTPATDGAITLTFTNAQAWTNPSPLTYTSTGSYTAIGPATGPALAPSTNFTVALHSGMTFSGAQTITIDDGTSGGTITPSVGAPGTSTVTVTPPIGASLFTFTYTAPSVAAFTLAFTNAQSWPDPTSLTYTATALTTDHLTDNSTPANILTDDSANELLAA